MDYGNNAAQQLISSWFGVFASPRRLSATERAERREQNARRVSDAKVKRERKNALRLKHWTGATTASLSAPNTNGKAVA